MLVVTPDQLNVVASDMNTNKERHLRHIGYRVNEGNCAVQYHM